MEEAVKERENLYKLIISQLRYDGCEAIAASLAKTTNIVSPCPPSARLHQVVNLGLRAEAEGARPENNSLPGLTNNLPVPAKGIDLEYEPEEYNELRRNGGLHPKPGSSSDSGGESDRENVPPREVQEHILRITKNKVAAEEIKVVRSNGEVSSLSTEEISADNVCLRVKQELQKMNISQEVFAKSVLGKTQGYLSEMLKHGEKVFYSREKANSKGRMNFEKMRMFLLRPEEERRAIYTEKVRQLREERLLRKRMSFSMAYSPQSAPSSQHYDIKPSKMRCYSPPHSEHDNSYHTPAHTGTPTSRSQHVTSPHHSNDTYHPIIVKSEKITPVETNGYKNLPHPRSLCNRLVFLREDPLPRDMTLYPSKKDPDEVEVDKNLVTTKIAALSRKQLTPSKSRPQPEEREPERAHYYTHRRHSESEDSSNGIPEDIVTIETLPLQSLASEDNEERPEPLIFRRTSIDRGRDDTARYRFDRHSEYEDDIARSDQYMFARDTINSSKVEIGENVYVVQVDGTDAIRVTTSS